MRTIVVGVDGSEASIGALVWAQSAAGDDDTIRAVVAWAYPADATSGIDGLSTPVIPFDVLEGNARRILDDALALVPAAGVTRESEVSLGVSEAGGLLEAATGADLLVVGTRPHSRLERVLGTVAVQCGQHAPCPFVAVPESAPPLTGTMTVAYDGSDASHAALEWAAATAARRDLALRIVSVWEQPGELGGFQVDQHQATTDDRAVDALRDAVTRVVPSLSATTDYRAVQASGRVAPKLVEASEGTSALVMGSRGRGGFSGLLLGSVSQRSLEMSPIPVVIVRE